MISTQTGNGKKPKFLRFLRLVHNLHPICTQFAHVLRTIYAQFVHVSCAKNAIFLPLK